MQFEDALQGHNDLKVRLILYMNGIGHLDEQDICNPNQCSFGQWLDVVQSKTPECVLTRELVETHGAFHVCGAKVVSLLQQGQKKMARTYVQPEGLLLQLSVKISKALAMRKQHSSLIV